MWSSGVKEKLCSCNYTKTGSHTSSSSFSLSSSSSASSSTPSPFSPLPNTRSIEDVWKDIWFPPHYVDCHPSDKDNAPSLSPLIFQDLFNKESQTKVGLARCVSPAPSPATFLSLNPGPDFPLFGNSSEKPPLRSKSLLGSGGLEGFCGSSGVNVKEKKRNPDPGSDFGDHRHKRMIKNRESASRSRARKQAYTNELEMEVNNLRKEIASLQEQLNQFQVEAAAQRYPRKYSLQRSLSSPL